MVIVELRVAAAANDVMCHVLRMFCTGNSKYTNTDIIIIINNNNDSLNGDDDANSPTA